MCALFADVRLPAAAAARVRPTDATANKACDSKSSAKPQQAKSSLRPVASKRTPLDRKTLSRKKSARVRGQQKIDSERAQAIQEALIREHYLSGEATGTWNQASEEAMRRYQADNGWQSKTVPDSRALIKLGLGPEQGPSAES